MSEYQLNIADVYNIPIGSVKKLLPEYDKEKCVIHYENLKLYLRVGLKLKNAMYIRIQSISIAKTICWIQYKKKKEKIIEAEKKYKLINNAVHGKTIKTVRNRIDVKLVRNKKYLPMI